MKTIKSNTSKIISILNDKFLLIIFGLLVFGNVYSQNSNCNAKLEVVNNQSSKKAGESGTSYRLKLTNTGFTSSTYEIKLVNDNNAEKRHLASKNDLIDIKGDFYNVSLKKMELKKNSYKSEFENGKEGNDEKKIKIFLDGNASKTFIVKMKTPVGAKIGSKNISKVIVTSNKCKSNIDSVILNTEIIDGE
jgi:hypothetical protein